MKYFWLLLIFSWLFFSCGGKNNQTKQQLPTDSTQQGAENITEKTCDTLSIISVEVEGFKVDTLIIEDAWISDKKSGYIEITFANYPIEAEEQLRESNSYNYNPQYYTTYDFKTGRRQSREKVKIVLQLWNQEGEVGEGVYQYLNGDKRVFSPFVYIKGKEYSLHGRGGSPECGLLEIYKNDGQQLCAKMEAKVEKSFLGEALSLRGSFTLSLKNTTPKPLNP